MFSALAYVAWYKHKRGWENSWQLCKAENPSSVYIRLCKHRKKVFYCFYKINFPKKNAKLFIMALIKRKILTSRKVLYTKSWTHDQFCFSKRCFPKYRIFSLKMSDKEKKKITQLVCKVFQSFCWQRNG